MAAINRDKAIQLILQLEGGDRYTDDPQDKGRATKYGISASAYPGLDIKNLTEEQAIAIYSRDYWDKVRGDDLRSGLDLMVFDCAVNQGTSTSIKLLQAASGVAVDGSMGKETLAASALPYVLRNMAKLRMMRYIENPQFNHYGSGWTNRLFKTFEESVKWQC